MGSDLHGREYLKKQSNELVLRSYYQKNIDVLRSATSINAEILNMRNKIGTIKKEAFADLIVLKKNPINDINVFNNIDKNLMLIIKDGEIIKNSFS